MAPEKHIFVVNPIAGGGTDPEEIRRKAEKLGVPFEMYVTRGPKDAHRFVRQRAETGEILRFYACGGDGTLKEVAEGAAGLTNVSVACYAVGSGNDFVRVWGGREVFLNLADLAAAEDKVIDAISVNDQVCLNACHFGFDSMVADTMNAVRSKKVIGGRNAYTTGVIKGLISGMKTRAVITADGEEICSDSFLLCSVCNGGYVGGGYHCAPRSLQDDGLLELCLVRPVSRLKFLQLMDAYREGKHLEDPRFRDLILYRRCRTVEIRAGEGFAVSLDGEILKAPEIRISVLPGAIRFAIPAKKE